MRVGFDIGGTFTDLVLSHGDARTQHKVLTTPRRPAAAALQGLDELLEDSHARWDDVEEIVHGTTLVTNALIERRGAATGLITTRGFGDVLAFGRQQRYDAYDLRIPFPEPLVPRALRREVTERTLTSGAVLERVDPADVVHVAGELVEAGVETIAICFLHSYAEPANETAAAAAIRSAFPELIVTVSSEVAPIIREYERAVTATACASAQPVTSAYMTELVEGLATRGFDGRLLLMQSSGGTATSEVVTRVPIRLLESGPAGGVRAAAEAVAQRSETQVLSFDMGGTTAKACISDAGAFGLLSQLEIARVDRFIPGSGLPVYVPSIDLIEIGAGGGSIASVDRLGLLVVGPESAGADPGPACYGRGGSVATVTDANLLLGYLGESSFLGGRMALDRDASEHAMAAIAERLGLPALDAAAGIHRLVNENMAAAARIHVIGRNMDPRRLVLVASGGAGPVHAVGVARLLGIARVIVASGAGTLSASGLLLAPATYETGVSLPAVVQEVDWSEVGARYAVMEEEAAGALREAGVAPDDIRFERTVEMRLLGQVHELTVPIDSLDETIADIFLERYRARYGFVPPGMQVQALTWRLRAVGPTPARAWREHSSVTPVDTARPADERPVWFPEVGLVSCPVHSRSSLPADRRIHGPAAVEEPETTTVVGPHDTFMLDGDSNLVVDLGGPGAGL